MPNCVINITGTSGFVLLRYKTGINTTTIKVGIGQVYIDSTSTDVVWDNVSGDAIASSVCLGMTTAVITPIDMCLITVTGNPIYGNRVRISYKIGAIDHTFEVDLINLYINSLATNVLYTIIIGDPVVTSTCVPLNSDPCLINVTGTGLVMLRYKLVGVDRTIEASAGTFYIENTATAVTYQTLSGTAVATSTCLTITSVTSAPCVACGAVTQCTCNCTEPNYTDNECASHLPAKCITYYEAADLANICSFINATFGTSAQQKNGVDQLTYKIPVLSTLGCQNISAPTGFAITGNTRKSAYGSMEWYATLLAANSVVVAGETILIFNDTIEFVPLRNNVNYEGIGVHKIGGVGTGSSGIINCKLSNLIVDYIQCTSPDSNIECSNVEVVTYAEIGGVWMGGVFKCPLQLFDRADISYFYTYSTVEIGYSYTSSVGVIPDCKMSHFIVNDIGPVNSIYSPQGVAVYVNLSDSVQAGGNSIGKGTCMVVHGKISTINNRGLQSETSGTANAICTDIVIVAGNKVGLDIHDVNNQNNNLSRNNFSNITVYNNGDSINPATVIHQEPYNNVLDIAPTEMNISNITSKNSNNGAGIFLATAYGLRNCHGYSKNKAGIRIYNLGKSTKTSLIECVGESLNSVGLSTEGNCYISGGTYISGLDTPLGNPIQIKENFEANTHFSFIAGVKTVARNISAYAISALINQNNDYPTIRISGSEFLNPFLATNVPGIDPNIILRPVNIDLYNNIS